MGYICGPHPQVSSYKVSLPLDFVVVAFLIFNFAKLVHSFILLIGIPSLFKLKWYKPIFSTVSKNILYKSTICSSNLLNKVDFYYVACPAFQFPLRGIISKYSNFSIYTVYFNKAHSILDPKANYVASVNQS